MAIAKGFSSSIELVLGRGRNKERNDSCMVYMWLYIVVSNCLKGMQKLRASLDAQFQVNAVLLEQG